MILLGSVLLFESLFYLLPLKDMLLIKIMLGFLPLKAGIFGLMIGQDHQLPYRQALLMLHGPKWKKLSLQPSSYVTALSQGLSSE